MQVYEFFDSGDLSSGVFINSRIDNLYTTNVYGLDRVVPDADFTTSTTTYASTLLPSSPGIIGWPPSWATINNNFSIATYSAGDYFAFSVSGNRLDITYLNSPQGGFVKHYIDNINIENTSTYGTIGTKTVVSIPLQGIATQIVKLVNSGFADKSSIFYSAPTNTVGTSMAMAITLRPNGRNTANDTYTFIGVNGSTFSITPAHTGVATNFSYGLENFAAIPGFDVYVATASTGDKATVTTHAPLVNVLSYTAYPKGVNAAQWQTPILNSKDPGTVWFFTKHNATEGSTTSYVTNVQVGNTPSPDNTWVTLQPTEAAVTDVDGTQFTSGFRNLVSSAGLTGQYAVATFSIASYADYIEYPRIYAANPAQETMQKILGPVIMGPTTQKIVASFEATLADEQLPIQRYYDSTAISTAEREYLVALGSAMGFPKQRRESLATYRNRLLLLSQAATSGGTLSLIQGLIQSYLNSNVPYIVSLQGTSVSWNLGASILAAGTYLGTKATNVWRYEVHVPGGLTGLIPDAFEAFVHTINPCGAVPIFVYE